MIIDWQHHASPKEVMDKRGGKAGQAFIKDGKVGMHLYPEVHQIDKHVEFMDGAGIDLSVLSATLDSVDDCRLTDDLYARVLKEHPKRFAFLAPVIPTRGEEALKELDRALSLGLHGVAISPQNDGEPMDSRKLWPFYEKMSRWNKPIFVHITNIPVGYPAMDAKYNLNVTVTRELDIIGNTIRLVLGGVLSEFPDLRIVMSHLGGGVSSILDRVERYVHCWGEKIWTELGTTPPFGPPYKENFKRLFDKIYFDMAGYEGGMRAVQCALTTISPDKLLFGTDYPYNFTHDPRGVRKYIEDIRRLSLPAMAIDGMLGNNAAKLLGL